MKSLFVTIIILTLFSTFPFSSVNKKSTHLENGFYVTDNKDSCIIEGTVFYVNPINTRGTKYPRGFILLDIKWLITPPDYQTNDIYIKGNVDSSFINKRVRIQGSYKTYEKTQAIDFTSLIIIFAEKIFLVEQN